MTVDVRDTRQTLEYRTATLMVRLLPTGLLLIFLALVIVGLADFERQPTTLIGVVLCFIFGIGTIAFALWRRWHHGKPFITLSPDGLRFRIVGVKEVLIPWREIKAVETMDVEAGMWAIAWSIRRPVYQRFTLRDVTVVVVSKQFYDRFIHVNSFFLRGPAWDANFIPDGDVVRVALHHEAVSTDPQSLRAAVEARWLAFRDQPEPARSAVPSVSATPKAAAATDSKPVVMGESPKSMPKWEAVKIGALLIGIVAAATNLAGLWDLPGQAESRAKRAQARIERQKLEETSRRYKEEWKQREAAEEKRRREFDETMRRAFSR